MLTAEYANVIRLLEDIGRTAAKEDRFSSIQSAIKVLRMELDREMDIREMSRFRREVVMHDPDAEPANGAIRTGGEERSEKDYYAAQESRKDADQGTEGEGMRPFPAAQRKSADKGGIRSVEDGPSGARRPFIRETDTDRIKVKLSSMKIEKMASRERQDSEKSVHSGEQSRQEDRQGLVKCRNCGAMISSRSVVCVSCGEFIR